MSVSHQALSTAHALKCELAGEVLCSSGRLRLQVSGWSMLPAIWPGDILLIERISGDASAGDIVLFARDRRLFVHRLVREYPEDSTILTRGDAMPNNDPAVLKRDVLGRVRLILRNGKSFEPCRRPRPSQRVLADVVRSSELAARVLVRMHGLLRALNRDASNDRAISFHNELFQSEFSQNELCQN